MDTEQIQYKHWIDVRINLIIKRTMSQNPVKIWFMSNALFEELKYIAYLKLGIFPSPREQVRIYKHLPESSRFQLAIFRNPLEGFNNGIYGFSARAPAPSMQRF